MSHYVFSSTSGWTIVIKNHSRSHDQWKSLVNSLSHLQRSLSAPLISKGFLRNHFSWVICLHLVFFQRRWGPTRSIRPPKIGVTGAGMLAGCQELGPCPYSLLVPIALADPIWRSNDFVANISLFNDKRKDRHIGFATFAWWFQFQAYIRNVSLCVKIFLSNGVVSWRHGGVQMWLYVFNVYYTHIPYPLSSFSSNPPARRSLANKTMRGLVVGVSWPAIQRMGQPLGTKVFFGSKSTKHILQITGHKSWVIWLENCCDFVPAYSVAPKDQISSLTSMNLRISLRFFSCIWGQTFW